MCSEMFQFEMSTKFCFVSSKRVMKWRNVVCVRLNDMFAFIVQEEMIVVVEGLLLFTEVDISQLTAVHFLVPSPPVPASFINYH